MTLEEVQPNQILLQQVSGTVHQIASDVAKLAAHVEVQNHRLEKIEHKQVFDSGVAEEREKWQKLEAANQKWRLGVMLSAAGLLSGIMFTALQAALQALK